jgi:hypothetical protein
LTDDSVAIAAGRDGVFEVSASAIDATARLLAGSDRVEYAARLAVADGLLATAAPFGVVAWRSRGAAAGWSQDVPLASILDFDAHGRRVLLLGGRRVVVAGEDEPQWAPQGGILFSSELDENLSALRLLLTARSGVDGKARELAACDLLELGAVRYLADGRYVVVPGVQPGIHLYAADGRLLRAWDSTPLGFYDACDVDRRESARLAADLERRISWWQRHEVLDDVVAWEDGFALLIRSPDRTGARWRLVPFGDEGPGKALELPVQAGSPGIHLRADSRGRRLALLIFDYELADAADRASGGSPRHRPRLVVLKRTGR